MEIYNNIIVINHTNIKNKYNKKLVDAKCHCGLVFRTMLESLKRNKTKSCGKCRKRNIVGKEFGNLKVIKFADKYTNGAAIWICLCYCGKEIELSSKQLNKKSRTSCGCDKRIRLLAGAQKRSGINSHFYKNTITDEERAKRRRKGQNIFFVNSVFKRDNYTCKKCHKRGGELNAHHMDSYHWYINGRTDVNNGITLCVECHNLFHSIYGKTWNTKAQFLQFIGQSYE